MAKITTTFSFSSVNTEQFKATLRSGDRNNDGKISAYELSLLKDTLSNPGGGFPLKTPTLFLVQELNDFMPANTSFDINLDIGRLASRDRNGGNITKDDLITHLALGKSYLQSVGSANPIVTWTGEDTILRQDAHTKNVDEQTRNFDFDWNIFLGLAKRHKR